MLLAKQILDVLANIGRNHSVSIMTGENPRCRVREDPVGSSNSSHGKCCVPAVYCCCGVSHIDCRKCVECVLSSFYLTSRQAAHCVRNGGFQSKYSSAVGDIVPAY